MTPLQMAMIAAAIGNNGVEMQPYVVSAHRLSRRQDDRGGEPHEAGTAGRAKENALALQEMMVDVVRRGTGTAVAIPGLRIGGKTGTAETGVGSRNTTWFICFAGPDDGTLPRLAVAVVLEGQTSTGGATAAPIARQVIEALLPQRGTPNVTAIHGDRYLTRGRLRRQIPPAAQARLGRHGRRVAGRGPRAGTARCDQDPPRALRERRAVRRALPPRGHSRRGALAPEHRLDLRPGLGQRLVLHRHGVRRGPHAKELLVARGPCPSRWRSRTRARSWQPCASRTATGSSTGTSSRTT